MNMIQAVKAVFSKYATFSGRARRAEYWWFLLFVFVAIFVLAYIDSAVLGFGTAETSVGDGSVSFSADGGPLTAVFLLATLLPGIAVTVRRLHDTDRRGWWILIGVIPLIGTLVLLWFYASKGTAGSNRFGEDPLA